MAARLFSLIDKAKIVAYVTASSITDIYYIAKKEKGHEKAFAFVSDLVQIVDIAGVDKNVVMNALRSEMKDFEDAIQVSAAMQETLDYIVTRNAKDFISDSINIDTPTDFLKRYT